MKSGRVSPVNGSLASVVSDLYSLQVRQARQRFSKVVLRLLSAARYDRRSWECSHGIRSVALSLDGQTLASCSGDGTIKVWRAR